MIKILNVKDVPRDEIFARSVPKVNVEETVAEIIANVRENGDKAIFEYNEKFDGAKLDKLAVSEDEINEAFSAVSGRFIEVLEKAAANIRKFHEKQVRTCFS